jgi:molybdate transport system ATP-binding protein
MSEPVVQISKLHVKYQHKPVFQDLNWTISRGDNWLLRGASGSGKTSLAKAIAGLIDFDGSIDISFNRQSTLAPLAHYVANWYQFKDLEGQSNFYYQQRYNKQAEETTATVRAELENYGHRHQLDFADAEKLLEALGFTELINSTLIQLSSGEHKKLQLVEALWFRPQLLIMDQPYNGLDKLSRQHLNVLLEEITAAGTQLILISNDKELPSSVNRFAELRDGQVYETDAVHTAYTEEAASRPIPNFLTEGPVSLAESIVKMNNVNISYGDKQVLKNITWEVKAGEKWLLQGHNGSGKSTLLSLITGDHPQAYANDFSLFGNRRGSGESIWDIKKRMGLISPELQWYFDASATVRNSIISGFFDSSGLFRQPTYSQSAQADELIRYFGLTAYRDTLISQLPLGKQRLAFLARTIIKNPELLILDEPCQGLDQHQAEHFNKLVDELCSNGTTLIYVGHFESQLPACIKKRILLENGEVKSVELILESI